MLSCFLGPVGVGLNELKRKLLISDTQHYGVTVPRKFDAATTTLIMTAQPLHSTYGASHCSKHSPSRPQQL